MSDDNPVFAVPDEWKRKAWIDADGYRRAHARSLRDPDGFWAEQAERLEWLRHPNRMLESRSWAL
jgi:acetyl-CoA synthetase